MKKPKISLIAAICMVLACAIVAGCAAAGPATMGTPTTNPATSTPTQPTTSKPADGSGSMKWIQLLTTVKKGNAIITELTYDEQWNLKGVNGYKIETNATRRTMTVYSSKDSGVLEEYQYDAAGNLTRYQDHDFLHPFTREFFYDSNGNLVKEIRTHEGAGDPYTGGKRIETVYTYDENGRKESLSMYIYTDSEGQEVCKPGDRAVYTYDVLGNLIREDWYDGNGERTEYMIYTADAKHRAERLDHFVRCDTPEGKIDILQTIHIYYYNAEGKVIRHEQYDPESHRLTYVETYDYQTVQVPEDFFGPTYINYTDREVIFRQDGQDTETPIIPQPEPNPTDPTEPIDPTRPEESPKPTEPDHNDQPTKPADAVFDTKNIVRITFYAYFGGGKGSDVPAENMAEIINWLNSFAVGEKAPDLLPPGTGTWKVEIEYADGTVVKRSLDTITIDGDIYYLHSDPQPEILKRIMSMVFQ